LPGREFTHRFIQAIKHYQAGVIIANNVHLGWIAIIDYWSGSNWIGRLRVVKQEEMLVIFFNSLIYAMVIGRTVKKKYGYP